VETRRQKANPPKGNRLEGDLWRLLRRGAIQKENMQEGKPWSVLRKRTGQRGNNLERTLRKGTGQKGNNPRREPWISMGFQSETRGNF
jgi:hypothetical protein